MAKKQTPVKNFYPLKPFDERFFLPLDAVGVGIAIISLKGRIIFFNEKIAEGWGYSREELVGKFFVKFPALFSQGSLGKALVNVTRKIAGKPIAPYELEILSKDGKPRRIEAKSSIFKHRGRPVALIVTIFDTTQRGQAENALKEKYEELERFNKIAIGRELRISELKNRIRDLEEELARLKKT